MAKKSARRSSRGQHPVRTRAVTHTDGTGSLEQQPAGEEQSPPAPGTEQGVQDQLEEELAEEAEAQEEEDRIGADRDVLTLAFEQFHKIEGAQFFEAWTPPNAPRDRDGYAVRFSRFYLHLKTVLDVVSDDMALGEIHARKTVAEAGGHRYTWVRQGELKRKEGIQIEEIFKIRLAKSKRKTPWPYASKTTRPPLLVVE